ncbi:hypothetical protein QL285_062641 [Trifolium repens]|nr:hypothetical protein QL285_062641 [Trifolium repens]
MKVRMKEQYRQFVYPKTMCPPPIQVKTKGALKGATKRPSYSQDEGSTNRSHSLFEHVDSQNPDTLVFRSSCGRKKSARKSSQSLHPTPVATPKCIWPNLTQLPPFMHPFFEHVIDVA